MGAKQTKGQDSAGASPSHGASPQHGAGPPHGWRRTPSRERDLLASLMLKPGERLSRGTPPPPYQRRIGMIQDMMLLAKQGKHDEATETLKTLRQDLGMESTSLDDVLYKYASFRNLVDPITHDLIISLARYVHCPKTEGDSLGAMEKVCRQLTYHLSPHSQWRRQGLLKRKPQACLKAVLSAPPSSGTLDLSGIPLSARDMERVCGHLQRHSAAVVSLELGFSELTDEAFLLLLPTLSALPRLETLALNGNRLTRAVLKELTDALKDPSSFPSVTWIDLGNNVDIFSLPQPFLVSLRKRCPKQGNLPTILEFGESQASEPPDRLRGPEGDETDTCLTESEMRSEVDAEMDGETEIEDMMEELLDFDRETQGPDEDEDDSMWTVEEQRRVSRSRRRQVQDSPRQSPRKGGHAKKAEMDDEEDDTRSRSSRMSCSSQSQHSPQKVEMEDLDETTDPSEHLT